MDGLTDKDYLIETLIFENLYHHFNEDLLYDFSERVSIAVIDGGVDLNQARKMAFETIMKSYLWNTSEML